MKKLLLIIAFSVCMVMTGHLVFIQAAAPDILWQKPYGGGETDNVFSVRQTADKGFVFAGQTGSDVWVVKTDAKGDTNWIQAIEPAEGGPFASSVRQTADGGYIIVANSTFIGSSGSNIWMLKTDANGDTVWNKTFAFLDDGEDNANTVEQLSDGGYILYGNTTFESGTRGIWLLKIDAAGDTVWTKTFEEGVGSSDHELALTSDGGFIFTGQTGSGDVFVVKTDGDGNTVWSKTYDGGDADAGKSIANTADGGYIVTGYITVAGESANLWLIKIDADGNEVWAKIYGGARYDEGRCVQQTVDGGYFITGMTMSSGAGRMDAWILKTDASGDTTWTMTWGGSKNDQCYSGQQTDEGGYIVSVSSDLDASDVNGWLIRLGADKVSGGKTIIWVNDQDADSLWIDLLRNNGYTVQVETETMHDSLTQEQKDVLESGDLVIHSPATTSSYYEYPESWNSITAPLILTSGNLTRNNRWQWFNSQFADEKNVAPCVVVNPAHPIFNGVTLDADNKVDVLLPDVGTGRTLFTRESTLSGPNGEILAKREDNEAVWIAYWDAGKSFYEDTVTPTPAGNRLLFSAGGAAGWKTITYPGGEYNITPAGEKMFLNAVAWMLDPNSIPVGIKDAGNVSIPMDYELQGNYPNPFNPETTIHFLVPRQGLLSMKIYNMMGQEIVTLVNADYQPGVHRIQWNGKDRFDHAVPSGVYFYQLQADGIIKSDKMVLMK